MCDACGDNRFELIEKYKQKLIESTNISDSPEEMAVIDNILFRFWQMGWLKGELFGNSEQLEANHKKDHVADPGKMVGDLISRAKAIETVRKAKSIGQAHRMLVQLPSAQSTIYGYDIDCLQFIAYLMREKGITPEEALSRFADYTRMAEWIRSQVLSEIGREIKEQCGIG